MSRIFMSIAVVCAIIAAVGAIPAKSYEIRPLATAAAYPAGTPAMERWLNALRAHEGCPPEGIIDSNEKRSYGPYCFQAATFAMFKKQFAPTSTAGIADGAFQRWLTRMIVEKADKNGQNWANSVREIGLPPRN